MYASDDSGMSDATESTRKGDPMPMIDLLLTTIQDDRRRRIEASQLARLATAGRPSFGARLHRFLGFDRARRRSTARPVGQPAAGSGSASVS
jgi:hypothetical protein